MTILATLQAKLIAIALGALLLTGAGGAAYVGYLKYEAERTAVTVAQSALANEQAKAAAAQAQASALSAAMDAQKTAAATAKTNRVAAGQALASAVAAAPAAASAIVPESYWEAIYGKPASEAQ